MGIHSFVLADNAGVQVRVALRDTVVERLRARPLLCCGRQLLDGNTVSMLAMLVTLAVLVNNVAKVVGALCVALALADSVPAVMSQ